jgi:hypothetical protein
VIPLPPFADPTCLCVSTIDALFADLLGDKHQAELFAQRQRANFPILSLKDLR